MQVGGRLLVGLLGTSPLKPSEVALLDVASVNELIASKPEQWQTLQRSSTAQVCAKYLVNITRDQPFRAGSVITSVDELAASNPEQWQMLQRCSTGQVSWKLPLLCCLVYCTLRTLIVLQALIEL